MVLMGPMEMMSINHQKAVEGEFPPDDLSEAFDLHYALQNSPFLLGLTFLFFPLFLFIDLHHPTAIFRYPRTGSGAEI